eukprot:c28819_g1_i1 orf=80-3292(+)
MLARKLLGLALAPPLPSCFQKSLPLVPSRNLLSAIHLLFPEMNSSFRGGRPTEAGGGGRGRRGGRGGGGRGGGNQRWWDPVWRAEKLKQIREEGPGSKEERLDQREWQEKMESLKTQIDQQEIIIKQNFGREGARLLENMAGQAGLYFHAYNKGRNTVLVVSKAPLPNYRADLDDRHGSREREIYMSADTEYRVKTMLESFRNADTGTSNATVRKESSSSECNVNSSLDADSVWIEEDCSIRQNPGIDKLELSMEMRDRQRQLQGSSAVAHLQSFRKKLPAYKMRKELLQAVNRNQVLVVSGETGCGKTTQLPQFILEEEIEAGRGGDCNIICTQPRRISAISVSSRVAAERGESVGETVGYQIRLESRQSMCTRLLFCTTGVLLRRLVQDPGLAGVSHVLVDEIHERGMNEDFLIIILRDLLLRRPNLRLVLMSATINAELFSSYFNNAPMIHIPGFTYPVKQFFLEDVLEKSGYSIVADDSSFSSGSGRGSWRKIQDRKKDPLLEVFEGLDMKIAYRGYSNSTHQSLYAWNGDQLDLAMVEATIEYICRNEGPGAILVFLTGWDDISKLLDRLKVNALLGNSRSFLLLPLHGSMPTINQREIFQHPPEGTRKIVLATNIAETSITIDDVVYVVDCGKAKETSYDALNKLACLTPSWISKASVQQRKGRAGRVQPGVSFHLYPKIIYEAMPQYQLPEILRTPLQELCLQIKRLQLGLIADFLSKALQPPEKLAVQNAIDLLKTIGALDETEELTALGRHLATLPLDPRVGKMLLMGAVFECLGSALTIAAALGHRDPFVLPIDKKEVADAARRQFAGVSYSDHIAILRAFEEWQVAKRNGKEQQFCWKNFLSAPTLRMMEDMRLQFLDLLSDIGFVVKSRGPLAYDSYSADPEMVKAVLCAGLFPNVVQCKRRGKRTIFYTKDDGKVDPHPASVNARANSFPQPWLVYSDKVKTTGIFIRDSTNVSDYAMLMFGGSLEPSQRDGVEMLGGYLHFSAAKKTTQLVQDLRKELDTLLQKKIEQPQLDIHVEGRGVVNAVVELLHSDPAHDQCEQSWTSESASWHYGGGYRR